MKNNLHTSLELRIDWSELDYFGHVNNVSYFKYVQAARVHYWDQIGLNKMYAETRIGPMLVSCQCDFKRPLFFPGFVRILSSVNFIKNTSFGISHQLLNAQQEIVAEAVDIIVLFDFNTHTKHPIPDFLRNNIERIEGNTM